MVMPAELAEAAKLLILPPNEAPDFVTATYESVTFCAAPATAVNMTPTIGTLANTLAARSTLSPTLANFCIVSTSPSLNPSR